MSELIFDDWSKMTTEQKQAFGNFEKLYLIGAYSLEKLWGQPEGKRPKAARKIVQRGAEALFSMGIFPIVETIKGDESEAAPDSLMAFGPFENLFLDPYGQIYTTKFTSEDRSASLDLSSMVAVQDDSYFPFAIMAWREMDRVLRERKLEIKPIVPFNVAFPTPEEAAA